MPAPAKIDLFKDHKDQYVAPKKPVLVTITKTRYLTIEGQGPPDSEEFTSRLGALYAIAYTIKMTRKFDGGQDYTICKLEGQYWTSGGQQEFSAGLPDDVSWMLMIRTPDFVERGELAQAAKVLLDKGKDKEVSRVKLEAFSQGQCVQMLHLGPYEREHETLALMREFAAAEGLRPHGRHHEVYVSDPRRVPPERLKTILRMPVKPA